MLCLWNGEYEEHDITDMSQNHLLYMEKQHEKWVGHVVGDFTCLKVEYDWGKRDQRWTIKCNRCGAVSYQYHVADWRRGKGRSLVCSCRKREEELKKSAEKEKTKQNRLEKEQKFLEYKKEMIGKIYGDYKIVDINRNNRCTVKCTTCGKGKQKPVRIEDLESGAVKQCDHKMPSDFSDPKWIGQRNGHLVTIGKDGSLFKVRCDCGQQTTARGVDLFTRKAKKSCGLVGCTCSTNEHIASMERREKGFQFEEETEKMLRNLGYNASKTKSIGDFGVDIIVTEEDGTLTAVQCKRQDDPAGVDCIQEVYAGGRFYDCTKFSVICKSGFTKNAIIMARKLGVYLCESEYKPPENIEEYTLTLMPTYHEYVKPKKEKLPKHHQYTVDEITGTIPEICNYFGVLDQTVRYRMKHMGMSLEQAIKYKKMNTELLINC